MRGSPSCRLWLAMAAGALVLRATAAAAPLAIATFEADVTPPIGAPLCHGNVPPVKEILDPLTARGIILFGDRKPIVLCVVDWTNIANKTHDAWRKALAEAAGTTPDRVSVHTNHLHTAPGVDDSTGELLAAHGLAGRMYDQHAADEALRRAAAAAADTAKHPRTVTHLGIGRGEVKQFASTRRLLGPDGKVQHVRMSSCRDPKVRAMPEGTIDPMLRAISFWDGEKPLAAMTYYATHPQSYYGDGAVTADTIGVARRIREAALPGVALLHFNGAGGDIAAGKYNDGSHENREILGQRLAEGIRLAWEDTKKVPITSDDVAWRVVRVALPVRDTIREKEKIATLADVKARPKDRVFAARDLAWLRRMTSGRRLELGCLKIGPAWVLHMPGELCIDYQLAAQAMRPDEFVAMAAYADCAPGYIPLAIGYAQGGYEASFVSRVAPEAEVVLMGAMREMLDK